MNYKTILAFLIGAAIGAAVTRQAFKDKYEALAEEEIEAMREYYAESDLEGMTDDDYEKHVKEYTEVFDGAGTTIKNIAYRKPNTARTSYNKPPLLSVVASDAAGDEPKSIDPDKPYVITIEDFMNNCQDFDKASLTYYNEDDTLADEQEEAITDVYMTVGDDALLRFGDGSDDPDMVYVRNERLGSDYEVLRVNKSYQETVMGICDKKQVKRRGPEDDI